MTVAGRIWVRWTINVAELFQELFFPLKRINNSNKKLTNSKLMQQSILKLIPAI